MASVEHFVESVNSEDDQLSDQSRDEESQGGVKHHFLSVLPLDEIINFTLSVFIGSAGNVVETGEKTVDDVERHNLPCVIDAYRYSGKHHIDYDVETTFQMDDNYPSINTAGS